MKKIKSVFFMGILFAFGTPWYVISMEEGAVSQSPSQKAQLAERSMRMTQRTIGIYNNQLDQVRLSLEWLQTQHESLLKSPQWKYFVRQGSTIEDLENNLSRAKEEEASLSLLADQELPTDMSVQEEQRILRAKNRAITQLSIIQEQISLLQDWHKLVSEKNQLEKNINLLRQQIAELEEKIKQDEFSVARMAQAVSTEPLGSPSPSVSVPKEQPTRQVDDTATEQREEREKKEVERMGEISNDSLFEFTPKQKRAALAMAVTAAALAAAVKTYLNWRSYTKRKQAVIKKYKLKKLTPLQNKIWMATALASYGISRYLRYLVSHASGTLTDFVGSDPRALAELFYGSEPTEDQLNVFLTTYFGGVQ